jgi:hypothetical protein
MSPLTYRVSHEIIAPDGFDGTADEIESYLRDSARQFASMGDHGDLAEVFERAADTMRIEPNEDLTLIWGEGRVRFEPSALPTDD